MAQHDNNIRAAALIAGVRTSIEHGGVFIVTNC